MLFWPLLLGFTPSLSACAILIIALNLNQQISLREWGEWVSEIVRCHIVYESWHETSSEWFLLALGQQINPIKKIDTKNFILSYHTFGENSYIKFRIKIRQITIKSLGKYVMHRRDFYSYPILCWIWIYDQKFTSLQLAVTRIIVNCGRKTSRY